jgi:hypothetical protein
MTGKPGHVERGGEVHADTPDKWSEDDKARQEQGLPNKKADVARHEQNSPNQADHEGKGHGPLKGTDTLATTDVEYIDREKGKRTTM